MLLLFSHQSTFLLSYDDVKAKLNPIAYRERKKDQFK
jgi:hypothetical protein